MFATRAADRKRIVDLIKFNELIIFINYSGSAVWKESNEMRADWTKTQKMYIVYIVKTKIKPVDIRNANERGKHSHSLFRR